MNKRLIKQINKLYHYKDGKKVIWQNEKMRGDCLGLTGDCSGLTGDCSGLSGNLDDCKITGKERSKGIKITDLIKN